MKIVNPITMSIIKNIEKGITIRSLANKIGFAYSAVYKWVNILQDYGVLQLVEKGNKTIVKVNKNPVYKKFIQLYNVVSIIEKDRNFWYLVKNSKLNIRFVKGTAVAIWTQGSFITGDFVDRIYFLEVYKKDLTSLKNILKKYNIAYSEKEVINKKRPLIYIIPKKQFKIAGRNNLPVIPLNELISWCKKLQLDNILEQLDLLYNLKLNVKYSEISNI